MTIEIGAGVQLGAGITIGDVIPPAPTPLSSANIYYNMQAIIGGAANGTPVPVLTNYGTDGTTYTATYVPGKTQATVATIGGVKVLTLDGSGNNQWGYNIANAFTVSTGSLFMVGWTYAEPARLLGFGGTGTYQYNFFGWSQINNGAFLFRNTGDGGFTVESFTSPALQVFGIVKTGNTIKYYDNTTTPVADTVSGVYGFNTVGYREGFGYQPSTGYLGDLAWFDTALSDTEAASVISGLKSIYNIA